MLATSIAYPSPPADGLPGPGLLLASRPPRRTRLWWLMLLFVWLLSAAYMGHLLMRGWVPHDEGTLAESAMRVQAGDLPHRDFDELYTGGLSYMNAFAFRVLGTNLASMRIVLFVWFLAWVPAVYCIASLFASPLGAAGVTLLAVAWGPPNYTAAMPTWYNLFLATFGLAALFRHLDTGSRLWLFVAGLCGGGRLLVAYRWEVSSQMAAMRIASGLLSHAWVYRLWQPPFVEEKFAPILAHNDLSLRQTGIPIARSKRQQGKSEYSAVKLFKLAFDGIFAFSVVPLRAAAFLGGIAVGLSGLFAVYSIFVKIFLHQPPKGFTALTLLITFLSGVTLLSLGIIGEYVGRIYEEIKARPIYLVSRIIGRAAPAGATATRAAPESHFTAAVGRRPPRLGE